MNAGCQYHPIATSTIAINRINTLSRVGVGSGLAVQVEETSGARFRRNRWSLT